MSISIKIDSQHSVSLSPSPKGYSEIVPNMSHEHKFIHNPINAVVLSLSLHFVIRTTYPLLIRTWPCVQTKPTQWKKDDGSRRTARWDKNDMKWPYVDVVVVLRQSNYTDRKWHQRLWDIFSTSRNYQLLVYSLKMS